MVMSGSSSAPLGIAFALRASIMGFSCADSGALPAACDALSSADLQAFFDRWSHRLPWPMTVDERGAGTTIDSRFVTSKSV